MNNDVIKLLPDSVANQIAAGEVIQRPASVVKELVENAVDAGATTIKIVLKDAGRTLIQVIDNGSGMSETDARLAFERHSTSKITNASDLFALNTMGFRGEALASIAAVARVELHTKRKGDSLGTCLRINGSKVESQEPDACSAGANFLIKDLFFNVPARRKFLKKDTVELSNIIHEFERLALVNPGHELILIHNDIMLHQLLPGTLKQRVSQLFGKSIERQLLPVETATSIVKINGFISLPEGARKRNWLQYLFVNGRNMKHPYFHKAIINCYEKLISPEVQPNYFINFEVDPATIDVNIHPTKNEIKFENEQAIWQILEAAVRETLGKFNVAPAIDFSTDNAPEIPPFAPNATASFNIGIETENYNPFAPENNNHPSRPVHNINSRPSALNWKNETQATFSDWDKLYANWANGTPEQQASVPTENFEAVPCKIFDDPDNEATNANSVLQFKNKYIISPTRSGLIIIDQHRAHTRILFEKFLSSVQANDHVTQSLIFPEPLSLSASQEVTLTDIQSHLVSIGFDIAKIGKGNWLINGVPAFVADQNPVELLQSIIDSDNKSDNLKADLDTKIALSMAKAAAIKSGQKLTTDDMERLVSDLFAIPTPTYTPDGKLVLKIIDTDTLTRSF